MVVGGYADLPLEEVKICDAETVQKSRVVKFNHISLG